MILKQATYIYNKTLEQKTPQIKEGDTTRLERVPWKKEELTFDKHCYLLQWQPQDSYVPSAHCVLQTSLCGHLWSEVY